MSTWFSDFEKALIKNKPLLEKVSMFSNRVFQKSVVANRLYIKQPNMIGL